MKSSLTFHTSFQLGNLKDAIKDCTDALAINDKYLKALLKRARCHYDMENYDDAVRDYETALKLDKSHETKSALKDAKLQLKKSKRKDYYKILGINKSATEDEIKKAYRKRGESKNSIESRTFIMIIILLSLQRSFTIRTDMRTPPRTKRRRRRRSLRKSVRLTRFFRIR